MRPVTVAQQDDTRAVIANGVQAEERVVTTGFTRLSAGTRVNVQQEGAAEATPAPPNPEAGRSGRRKRTENTPATPSAKQ